LRRSCANPGQAVTGRGERFFLNLNRRSPINRLGMAIANGSLPRGGEGWRLDGWTLEGWTLEGAGLRAIGKSVISAAIAVFWTATTAFAGAARQAKTQPSKAIFIILIVQPAPIEPSLPSGHDDRTAKW
jgi:hypothetical protein